jgi:hypothetical protein
LLFLKKDGRKEEKDDSDTGTRHCATARRPGGAAVSARPPLPAGGPLLMLGGDDDGRRRLEDVEASGHDDGSETSAMARHTTAALQGVGFLCDCRGCTPRGPRLVCVVSPRSRVVFEWLVCSARSGRLVPSMIIGVCSDRWMDTFSLLSPVLVKIS